MSFAKQIVDKNSNVSSPYDWKDSFCELLNDAFFGYSQHILGCRERDEQLVENASFFGMQIVKKDSWQVHVPGGSHLPPFLSAQAQVPMCARIVFSRET